MKDWVLSVTQWHDMVFPGKQPELMLKRCLSDELYPCDTKQSLEEVAVHLSNSGLPHESEESAQSMEARPTPKTVQQGNNSFFWTPI